MAIKSSRTTKQAETHTGALWALLVLLLIIALSGWILYFVRSHQATADLEKIQSERDAAVTRLHQYEDTNIDDLINETQ